MRPPEEVLVVRRRHGHNLSACTALHKSGALAFMVSAPPPTHLCHCSEGVMRAGVIRRKHKCSHGTHNVHVSHTHHDNSKECASGIQAHTLPRWPIHANTNLCRCAGELPRVEVDDCTRS